MHRELDEIKSANEATPTSNNVRKERLSSLAKQNVPEGSSWHNRLLGNMAGFKRPIRIGALVFVVSAIFSMSFAQLGFWNIGPIDSRPAFLLLLIAPLIMGAMMFGPYTGALLGLYSGATAYAHAIFFPLDYYEIYFITPLNSFLLLTALGALAGFLATFAQKLHPEGLKRFLTIGGICTLLSLLTTILLTLNTIFSYGGLENVDFIAESLTGSPAGMAIQVIVDALLTTVLCCSADKAMRSLKKRGGNPRLSLVFSTWMLLDSFVVFMLAGAVIFSIATVNARQQAETTMVSEMQYLQKQITTSNNKEYATLLDGYETEIDGSVVIMDKQGIILATDDTQNYPIDASFVERIGYAAEGLNAQDLLDELSSESANVIQARDGDSPSMEFVYEIIAPCNDVYIAILRSSAMVYEDRFNTMLASSLLALLLITSIAFVAIFLLNNVIVRRIDETNESLEKITGGDLNERVKVRDTREFRSLSSGINTTVSALKDSITEAEQRNAQELATAKAIQESSLPREFPPFPDIDKFDIYASMKTAREVGGDFYDFFLIDENKLGFIIADVSGKGIPAALFMMTAKTQIQGYMESGLPIDVAVKATNHQLCIGNDADMFVTMFACILNYETGELNYVNAGHNPPVLFHEGNPEWLRAISGVPLGLYDRSKYKGLSLTLEKGDVLYLYTDGVTESMDADEELFGEERLLDTLRIYADMNPRSIGVGVRRAITDYTLDSGQVDDITMLVLKYGVPPEKKALMILDAVDTQLVHVHNFIHEELHRRNAPNSVRNPLDIAAEELFVNVCHYAYPDATPENPGQVRIGFEYEANPPSLTVSISDDGIPYNPLEKPDPVMPKNIEDIPIGGLGILMAKRCVDEMTYERVGDSNVLTFRKGW